MASTLGHNDKDAPAFSPASTQCAAPSAPAFYEVDDGMADANIPYAVQVEVVPLPQPTPAPLLPPQAPSAAPTSLYPQYEQPTRGNAPPPVPQQQQQLQQQIKSEWAISFCNCLSTPAHCCMSFFVPCVNAAYAANGIGQSGVLVGLVFFVLYVGWAALAGSPLSESSGATFGVAAFICILGFVVATTMLRRAVRRFDSIPGSAITDVCASFWCSCCVLSQLSVHTERMKPLRNLNAATLQAYHAA